MGRRQRNRDQKIAVLKAENAALKKAKAPIRKTRTPEGIERMKQEYAQMLADAVNKIEADRRRAWHGTLLKMVDFAP